MVDTPAKPSAPAIAGRAELAEASVYTPSFMRVVALLATYNEHRFIAASLEHLYRQGIDVYLIDHSSTDDTLATARGLKSRGLIGWESLTRNGDFALRDILARKEQLAMELEADWFMHVDTDEFRTSEKSAETLVEAFRRVDREGFNAVNFQEFTFIPTREAPDHDRPDFRQTMRSYYPFLPFYPHRVTAWKRQSERVELVAGGHLVRFPGLRLYPRSFPMRHYQFLSAPHFVEKYTKCKYDQTEVDHGWHGWRSRIDQGAIVLPSAQQLKTYTSNDKLDPSEPRKDHFAAQWVRK
jgi:hypothetical protein